MTIQEDITKSENALQTFKNNYEFAVKTKSKHRISKYKVLIEEEKLKLQNLESKVPIESNDRLREIIDALTARIDQQSETIATLETKSKEQQEKFDNFINPPKPEKPKVKMIECPNCGRTIKETGMKVHQTRWCMASKRE